MNRTLDLFLMIILLTILYFLLKDKIYKNKETFGNYDIPSNEDVIIINDVERVKNPHKNTIKKLEAKLELHETLLQKLLNHTHELPIPETMEKEITKIELPSIPESIKTTVDRTEIKEYEKKIKDRDEIKDRTEGAKTRQSSTQFDSNIPIMKKTTSAINSSRAFSSTEMKENSFWELELLDAIEIDSMFVNINLLDNKEMLLKIEMENENGVIVGSLNQKAVFNKNVVKISDIKNVIVKKIRITVLSPKLSKLALYEIKVFGKLGRTCDYYDGEFKRIREENMEKMIDNKYDTLNDREFKKYKSLYDSCSDKKKEEKEMKTEAIKENAIKFREMSKKNSEIKKKEADESKEKLILISKQSLKDEELAMEAKKLGISPPPPMYSKEEIDELRKKANWTDPMIKMNDEQAAKCMLMYNRYKSMKDKTEELGEKTINMPIFMDELKEKGIKTKDLFEEYIATCT